MSRALFTKLAVEAALAHLDGVVSSKLPPPPPAFPDNLAKAFKLLDVHFTESNALKGKRVLAAYVGVELPAEADEDSGEESGEAYRRFFFVLTGNHNSHSYALGQPLLLTKPGGPYAVGMRDSSEIATTGFTEGNHPPDANHRNSRPATNAEIRVWLQQFTEAADVMSASAYGSCISRLGTWCEGVITAPPAGEEVTTGAAD